MKEGPIADPEQRQELEQSLEQTLVNYHNIQSAVRQSMVEAARVGDQREVARQARRAEDWQRQVRATQTTLDTLRSTGTYRIRQPGDAEFDTAK